LTDREYLNRAAGDAISEVREKLPHFLTGRFFAAPTPNKMATFKSTLVVEVFQPNGWEEVWREIADYPVVREIEKFNFCLPGYRGAGEGFRRFPFGDGYRHEARIPNNMVRGFWNIHPERPPRDGWAVPRLTGAGKEQFSRLGLRDYKLAMGLNRDYRGKPPSQFVFPYAVFRNEDEWMTAKMRF
jgi:hypothetical protein